MTTTISWGLGAAVLLAAPLLGSFAALAAVRLPQAERRRAVGLRGPGLCSPPSRCDGCGHRIAGRDLVPVLSWLLLRGRCRHCGASVGTGLLAAELGALALGPLCLWLAGPTPLAAALLLLHMALLCCALAETWEGRLPERPALAGAALGLLLSALPAGWLPGMPPLRHAAPAALGGWLLLMAAGWAQDRLRPTAGLQAGRGEAALVALAGAWLGWHALPVVVLGACVLGLAQSLLRGVLQRRAAPPQKAGFASSVTSFVRGLPPTAFAPALAAAFVLYEATRHAFHIAF